MNRFVIKHGKLHLWLALLGGLFCVYGTVIRSRSMANAVTAATQSVKNLLAAVWSVVPFSVVEWLYVIGILGCLSFPAILILRIRKSREKLHTLYSTVLFFLCLCGSVWLYYCMMWGVNYYADGFQAKSGIYAERVTVDELERVTRCFAENLADLSSEVERDENGVFAADVDEIFAAGTTVYDNISQEFPFLAARDPMPKKMVFSRLFSMMNFTGFYTPFTGESNLNVDCPTCLLPANIAHELAHQRGFASEQECNFLAILAATTSDDVNYRYSGYLMGYIYLGNALHDADAERWREIYALLPDGVLADLRDHSAYWAQFRGKTAEVSKQIYDSTLKGYGQSEGIKSYGTVVDLLVAYY